MWIKEFEPITLDKYVSNKQGILNLKKSFIEGEKIYLIDSISSSGKTLLAKLFLKEHNLKYKIISSIEFKNNLIFKEKLNDLLTFKSFFQIIENKNVGIIIKDVDNIINDVIKLILKSKTNKICFIILNKLKINKNKKIVKLTLKKPSYNEIENFLLDIYLKKDFYLDNESFNLLYKSSNSDIRYIINFLEDIYYYIIKNNIKKIDKKIILLFIERKKKDINYQLYETIEKLIFQKNSINDNINLVYLDYYYIPSIIYDNLLTISKKNNDFDNYLLCLENYLMSEYIYNLQYEKQNSLLIDLYILLNSIYQNILFNKNNIGFKIKFSDLFNKLLKINKLNNIPNYKENLIIFEKNKKT
jgi:hypothetical protein